MANGAKIDRLEKKVTALSDALANLGSKEDFRELLKIIRFPGWTTPAEFTLVTATVDAMLGHAQVLTKLRTALIKGSKQVSVRG
ncbi:MAG TPA: hypothetical protein VGG06_22890 [Thermoanaerobaculia bacterium]|jgi:hypothetical protein